MPSCRSVCLLKDFVKSLTLLEYQSNILYLTITVVRVVVVVTVVTVVTVMKVVLKEEKIL